ncbi:hypothetical protein ACIRQY_02140 [Streptomyces sp. NPDC101490]|uniref:hypothetical protein n=1 Tax=Streptomyces sp. NPDC101490 TaxID=3366143 RepID=UPI0037FB55F2
MVTWRRYAVAGAVVAAVLGQGPGSAGAAEEWDRVGEGIVSGVSGASFLPGGELLVVHDNKRGGEKRVSAVRWTGEGPRADVLTWEGPLPVDLESLSAVPGRAGEYAALESSGHGYHFAVADGTARVLREFTVPGVVSGDNYEGFALVGLRGGLTAVWAHRGQDQDPAVVRAARLDWPTLAFGPADSAPLRVPYPVEGVRHVSDLAVSGTGRITVTSASDAGDDGPFDSAVYDAGTVRPAPPLRPGAGPVLELRTTPRELARYPGHKIEALGCPQGPGAGVLGTDDENQGGSVRTEPLCPR